MEDSGASVTRMLSIEKTVAKHDAQIGQLTVNVDRLATSLESWTSRADAKMDSIEQKVSGVGTISAKTVFNGTIAIIGALQIVFGASVTAGVIYVGLVTKPMNAKIDEEIKDRKITDTVVSENSQDIAAIKSELTGIRTYQDAVSQFNNWFNFYHQGQIDALKSIEMNRGE